MLPGKIRIYSPNRPGRENRDKLKMHLGHPEIANGSVDCRPGFISEVRRGWLPFEALKIGSHRRHAPPTRKSIAQVVSAERLAQSLFNLTDGSKIGVFHRKAATCSVERLRAATATHEE